MLKIVKIISINEFLIKFQFNTGEIKLLNMLPFIQNHAKLNGNEKLYNQQYFNTVEIGEFGELVWKNCIQFYNVNHEQYWDYDVSSEFAYQYAVAI